jgi:hypothetical protein
MEGYLATLAAYYEGLHDTLYRDLVASAVVVVTSTVEDENWYGDGYAHDVRMRIPTELYLRVGPLGVDEVEREIGDVLRTMVRVPGERVRRVAIEPGDPEHPEWRHRTLSRAGASPAWLQQLADDLSLPELRTAIQRAEDAIEDDPASAVGTAKELLETVCKTILQQRGVSLSGAPDVPALLKQTMRVLGLDRESLCVGDRGVGAVRRALGGLTNVVVGLDDLRNDCGTGHGREASALAPTVGVARLSVGAATAACVFLLETHLGGQADGEAPPTPGASRGDEPPPPAGGD